jgi:phage gpG-like protein
MGTIPIEEFAAHVKSVGDRLEHSSANEALADCRLPLIENVARNFASASSPDGTAWPPRKDNKKHPLLRLSLVLMNAATGSGAGHVDKIGERSLSLGVSKAAIPYAGVHQYGYALKNIPRRSYLGASVETLKHLAGIIGRKMLPKIFGAK